MAQLTFIAGFIEEKADENFSKSAGCLVNIWPGMFAPDFSIDPVINYNKQLKESLKTPVLLKAQENYPFAFGTTKLLHQVISYKTKSNKWTTSCQLRYSQAKAPYSFISLR